MLQPNGLAKQMDVIRHDNVAAYRPGICLLPSRLKDFGCIPLIQERPSTLSTYGQKDDSRGEGIGRTMRNARSPSTMFQRPAELLSVLTV